MGAEWKVRFRAAIEGQTKSLRAISSEAKVGTNYVQQILTDDKDPGFTRLARVLSVLGPEATVYVTSGDRMSADAHLRAALLAYGVKDQEDVATVMGLAKRLASQNEIGTPEQSQSGDPSQRANSHHEPASSRRR